MERLVVRCPHCGAEYLFEELFMGEDFIGKRYPVKDSKGVIQHIDGEEADMFTEYVCDYCDKPFKVKVDLAFTTTALTDEWSDEYVVEVYKNRINLEE